jgi:hypothetical protein
MTPGMVCVASGGQGACEWGCGRRLQKGGFRTETGVAQMLLRQLGVEFADDLSPSL